MDILTLALLQQQGQARTGNPIFSMLPLIILFFLFWVMIIVPQRRQAKAHAELVSALQKGDQVVTAGGIIGVISGVREDQVEIRSGTSTVVVERSKVLRKVVPTTAA